MNKYFLMIFIVIPNIIGMQREKNNEEPALAEWGVRIGSLLHIFNYIDCAPVATFNDTGDGEIVFNQALVTYCTNKVESLQDGPLKRDLRALLEQMVKVISELNLLGWSPAVRLHRTLH